MTNAITMVRGLRSAGMEPKIAEAVAEMVATHSDEHLATKADLARVEGKLTADIKTLAGKIETLSAQIRMLIVLVAGIYVGFAVLFIGSLAG